MPAMASAYSAKPVLVPDALVSRYTEAGFALVEPETEEKPRPRKSRKSASS